MHHWFLVEQFSHLQQAKKKKQRKKRPQPGRVHAPYRLPLLDTFWGPFLEGRGVLDDGGLGQAAVLLSLGERVQALGRQCVRRRGVPEGGLGGLVPEGLGLALGLELDEALASGRLLELEGRPPRLGPLPHAQVVPEHHRALRGLPAARLRQHIPVLHRHEESALAAVHRALVEVRELELARKIAQLLGPAELPPGAQRALAEPSWTRLSPGRVGLGGCHELGPGLVRVLLPPPRPVGGALAGLLRGGVQSVDRVQQRVPVLVVLGQVALALLLLQFLKLGAEGGAVHFVQVEELRAEGADAFLVVAPRGLEHGAVVRELRHALQGRRLLGHLHALQRHLVVEARHVLALRQGLGVLLGLFELRLAPEHPGVS
mmetsp:Transcript_66918/g.151179  ORF Transcript_66918/g.151179 Transcript_66918/m.151179 type:complete len:373 (-) Transcript_66918:462-1580(-)